MLNVPFVAYVCVPLTPVVALNVPADCGVLSPQSIITDDGFVHPEGVESTTPENCWPAIALKSAWAAAAQISITSAIAETTAVERRSKLNGLTIPRTPGAPWLDLTSSPAASLWTLAHPPKLRNWRYLCVFFFFSFGGCAWAR
jgi:hypothetical protein